MKKMLSIIALLAIAAFPLTFAKADEYLNYSKGELVSFKQDLGIADDDDEHIDTYIALEDSPAGQQYARVWGATGVLVVPGDGMTFTTGTQDYKTSLLFQLAVSTYSQRGTKYLDSTSISTAEYISLDELKQIFKMTEADGEYTIDMAAAGNKMTYLQKQIKASNVGYNTLKGLDLATPSIKGFFTGTLSEDGTKVYAIEFTFDAELNITAAKVKLVPATEGGYTAALVVSADKTFDCKGKKKLCYLCNGEYIYTEEGTQDATCTVAAEKLTENDCVTNAKTGTKEYIIEGLAVIGVAIVTLAVLKRKDLFRNI